MLGVCGRIGSGKTTVGEILSGRKPIKYEWFDNGLDYICDVLLEDREIVVNALRGLGLPEGWDKERFLAPVGNIELYKWISIAFADVLKMICVPIVYNTYGEKAYDVLMYDRSRRETEVIQAINKTGRQLMEYVGTVFRDIDPDYWIKQLKRKIDPLIALGARIVITDVRFSNEAEMILLRGKIITLARTTSDLILDRVGHESRWSFLLFVDKTTIIMNTGSIEDLKKKVMEFIRVED